MKTCGNRADRNLSVRDTIIANTLLKDKCCTKKGSWVVSHVTCSFRFSRMFRVDALRIDCRVWVFLFSQTMSHFSDGWREVLLHITTESPSMVSIHVSGSAPGRRSRRRPWL